MDRVNHLRSEARRKRGEAAELRDVGRTLSSIEDCELMLRDAAHLEAHAAKLEAEANALAERG
jgi:hypothetical protein